MLCHIVQLLATFVRHDFFLRNQSHIQPTFKDLDDSGQAILAALEHRPFASVRQLSRLTHLASTTVYRRLTESLGFVARHLRWLSHALSDAQKDERAHRSLRLLRMPEVQRDRAWHDIVTLDESRFYLSTDYEFVWLPRDEKFPKEKDTQFNRKIRARDCHSVCSMSLEILEWLPFLVQPGTGVQVIAAADITKLKISLRSESHWWS
jgi:hypothetical protein